MNTANDLEVAQATIDALRIELGERDRLIKRLCNTISLANSTKDKLLENMRRAKDEKEDETND